MHHGHVYGVVLKSPSSTAVGTPQSALPDPIIELVHGAASDFSKVRRAQDGQPTGTQWFQYARLSDGSESLRWPRLCEFLITQNGRRIIGRPLNGISQETFQAYLLTQVLSFALLRLGIESLHATTVVIEGKAVGFLGDCGHGKSTLAAACLQAGYPLLTDDLLVLKQAHGQLLAYPGPPRIKLMPHVARRWMNHRTVNGFPINPLTSKLIIPLKPHQHTRSPVLLNTLYVLRPCERGGSRVVIRRLPPRAAWCELTKGTFNLIVRDPDRLKRQFVWAGQLAERIAVKTLSYPRTLRTLPQVVNALVADVTSSLH